MGSYATKQCIVMRKDLQMRKGKMCAQAAHASMAFLSRRMSDEGSPRVYEIALSPAEEDWLNNSFAKVVLYVNSEEELMEIHEKAVEVGLVSHVVTDNGTTEFHGVPTRTAVAVGPDYAEKIDAITSSLPLL